MKVLQPDIRHRFSVETYEEMIDFGILTENDRVELIRGDILKKMPVGDARAACVKKLNRWFIRNIGDDATVGIQDPIVLSDSEPEPDVSLAKPRDDFYRSGKPRPNDLLLVIEVSDTTLEFDQETKLAMYAEAGIPEYWIVNLVDQVIEVYREPRPDGTYASSSRLTRDQTVNLLAFPGVSLLISEIL